MNSSAHGDFPSSSDGGPSTPVSAGQVSSSAREGFLSSVDGGKAYQAMKIEGRDTDNEASMVRVSMTRACELAVIRDIHKVGRWLV